MLGIFQSGLICPLRCSDRQCSDRDASAVQNPQAVNESFTRLSQHLRRGQPAIGEQHFAGRARAHAHLVFFLADAKPGQSLFENERRNAVMRRTAIRHRHRNAHVGVLRVGRECLPAVQHPAVAVSHRTRARTRRIRSRLRFRQRPRADPFPGRELRDVFLPLFVRTGEKNMIRAKRIVRGDPREPVLQR